MNIKTYICSCLSAHKDLYRIINEHFVVSGNSRDKIEEELKQHFSQIITTAWLLVEFPYVDKVYRDSFYTYFSSKLIPYKRDSIRISIFKDEITLSDFRDLSVVKMNELSDRYLGYITLRPTEPYVFGRSVLSIDSLKNKDFVICQSTFSSTFFAKKVTVSGFPYASQDGETITCAEITIWSIMEYFGNHYPDYRPVLPSRIINTLNQIADERLLPSRGLNISQISYALKEFGLGSRIYAESQYKFDKFKNLFSCYVESGIPLITALETPDGIEPRIGHATVCIGHEFIKSVAIDDLHEHQIDIVEIAEKVKSRNIKVFDFDDIEKHFVFMDDNLPPYHIASFEKPTLHPAYHKKPDWEKCKISHFVIPLYLKVYLEAFKFKRFVLSLLIAGPVPITPDSEILLRSFLTSSRSFKDNILQSIDIRKNLKHLILEAAMPKFIWVTEISTKKLMKQGKANGIIIIDATEPNTENERLVILAAYQGNLIFYNEKAGALSNYHLTQVSQLINKI